MDEHRAEQAGVPREAGRTAPSGPGGARSRRVIPSVRRGLGRALGLTLPRFRRSLWVLGGSAADFVSAAGLLQALAERAPHYRLVLLCPRRETLSRLVDTYVDDDVLPLPWRRGPAARRYVRRLRPGAVLLIGPAGPPAGALLAAAASARVPILSLDGRAGRSEACDLVLGQPGISPFVPPVRQSWRIPSFRDRAGQGLLWRSCAGPLMSKRIDDWETLRARLRRPESVLCLGNGPSSEDVRLAGFGHDCLLRVNWRWMRRGILTDPDMVFVGDPATLHRLSPRLFGLWNIAHEYGMLLRFFLTHGPRRMEYITMERLSPVIRDNDWPARPSNGALMVAAAASLRPARLAIAGLDLFQHPAGRYPDDGRALNAYSRVHTRDVDLDIIRLALRDYSGELVVFGEPLARGLADLLAGRPNTRRLGREPAGA